MDLGDLDELAGLSRVGQRTTKFAPKPKAPRKQKPDPLVKPEPQFSTQKKEPQANQFDTSVLKKKDEDDEEKPPIFAELKSENGTVGMEIDVKLEDETVEEGGRGEEEEEEEEDVVVREIDVFFKPSVDSNTKFYVLQYPLRPSWRPYELDERCEEVRVKPATSQMELDLSIDVDSNNFDSECASYLKMEKQTLHTEWQTDHGTGYTVGILMGNKLHLNPIHAVVQLRPSLDHVTSSGSKRKNIATTDAEVAAKTEVSVKEKSVISSNKQSKVKQSPNEQKADDEEQWVPLKYQGSRSDASAQYLQKMIEEKNSPLQFTMNPYDYVDSLCPGSASNPKDKGLSRRLLFSVPLDERIKKLLSEGSPLQRFTVLKHFAPDTSVEDLLEVLQKHAMLVQGLWVPKSSWLLPDPSKALARDYVLLLFSKSPFISLAQVNDAGSHKEAVKGFLKVLAIERSSFKDWKLKEAPDTTFIKNYPDIVQKQEQVWKAGEENVIKRICRSAKVLSRRTKPNITGEPEKVVSAEKEARRMTSERQAGKVMSVEACEAIPKALKKIFQIHKVCSRRWVCQCLRDMAIKKVNNPTADTKLFRTAAEGLNQSEQEFLEILNQVAVEIHGDNYVLRSSPEHPEYDPLRGVVIDLLRVKGKLKKADVMEAAAIALKREIANNEYTKVMADLCESRSSWWVLKRSDGEPA